ncbi:hypothetical protein GCM10011362_29400 [Marinobacter halophilus]|uniref:Uncharacterized protein n=1 Tax=Marinobacter halophilus TaxID=1323740 RepID=A0A2T1KGQ0_9GAMM|nr:hypothetical protein C7H08_04360 [Marinobacter halophilus]GGC78969.1 hypothetical protein GCM10011362_29400 [Marinobacter halophilus]
MPDDIQEPRDTGAKVAGSQPEPFRLVKRLFNMVDLRLFRHTAVLLPPFSGQSNVAARLEQWQRTQPISKQHLPAR